MVMTLKDLCEVQLIEKNISWLKKSCQFFRLVGILNTLYFNLRVFPLKLALKFPVILGKNVQFQGLYKGCVSFHPNTKIKFGIVEFGITRFPLYATRNKFSLIRINSDSRVILGENIIFHSGCSLVASMGGVISVGKNSLFNQNVLLYACTRIDIGEHFRCGWESQIIDSDFHYVYDKNNHSIRNNTKGITIGRCCWIANRVKVSKGAVLPETSIVAANSLLKHDYGNLGVKGNLFAGSPAVLKRTGVYRVYNTKLEKQIRKILGELKSDDMLYIDDDSNLEDYIL